MSDPVDQFIAERVQPEHRAIAERLRALMRELVPAATEAIAYGIPTWRLRNIIAVLSPTKKDVTFSFSRGAEFEDVHGLLGGVGNTSKYIKFRSLDGIDSARLKYYLDQAVALDAVVKVRAAQPTKARSRK